MKKSLAVVSLLFAAVLMGVPYIEAQQAPASTDEWVCPGYGQGRMLGRSGRGCPRVDCPRANLSGPLTLEQAEKLLENYVLRSGNPNLKPGQTVDMGDVFKSTVVTKDGSLVEEIEINKKTGWFKRASN